MGLCVSGLDAVAERRNLTKPVLPREVNWIAIFRVILDVSAYFAVFSDIGKLTLDQTKLVHVTG